MPHPPYRLTAVLSAAAILAPAVVGPLITPPSAQAALPVSPATRTTPRTADGVLAAMSLEQRVGQLFMVGTPATSASPATLAQIGRYHVGNVMLTGRSYAGTRGPARVSAKMQARTTKAATSGVRLLVSTDQEGGNVQVLRGRGISAIPTALRQGRYSTTRLRSAAGNWARQLRAAGVNMNLAPVLDTVPGPAAARRNPPIGVYKREYGYTTARVANHGTAFAAGMDARGVVPTIKHFPGLGRVSANTDTARRVTDRTTRRGDPYLTPFRHAIRAGHAPFVMMATAYYTRMDKKNPAAFSPFIIKTVLRHDLGFGGAVISDDLASARQVSGWSYGARAVKFLSAGGSVVLAVNPDALPAMYRAVLARAKTHPGFRATVDRAALLVLRVKERRHLLGG